MATQFLVRSQSNAYPLKLRSIVYDGITIFRITENGMAVFEIADSDVVIELVIRRKSSVVAGRSSSSNNNANAKKQSSAVSAAYPAKRISSHKPSCCSGQSSNHNASARKQYNDVTSTAKEAAQTPKAQPATTYPVKMIAAHKLKSSIVAQSIEPHPIEHGSIMDRLMNQIEKTHTRQEIENYCKAIEATKTLVTDTPPVIHNSHKETTNYTPRNKTTTTQQQRIQSNIITAEQRRQPSPSPQNNDQKLSKFDSIWNERYNELVEYKRKHGNILVPRGVKEWKSLHSWIDDQRKRHKKGKLRQDRFKRLNEIGLSWEAWEALWNLRYSQLMMFKREFGHCRVPQKYEPNPQLGEWVIEQRSKFRVGTLIEERMAKLNELDFAWDGKRPAVGEKVVETAAAEYTLADSEDDET